MLGGTLLITKNVAYIQWAIGNGTNRMKDSSLTDSSKAVVSTSKVRVLMEERNRS